MDFSFSEEQLQLQEAVTRFVQGDYGFEARRHILATKEGWSREVWQSLADLGLLSMNIPEELGGLGYGPVETLLAMQAAGPAMLAEPLLASGVIATVLIRDFGDAAAKDQLLGAMAAGERIVVVAHTEAAARGTVGWVETTAKASGDQVVLNGHKAVVWGGGQADELIVSARMSGAAGDANGVSLFRVPKGTAGLTVRDYGTLDGRRAADITLANVTLPASARLGADGQGLPAVERAFDIGLAALMAEALGTMQATVDATIEYLKTRQQFGQPIGRFQALQHRTADMLMHLEQSRSMAFLAAMACTNTDDEARRKVLSAAKVTLGNGCRYISQQAVQLHGGMGMTDELNVSHFFKRLAAVELSFGDSDTHLQRFAQITQREALAAAKA
jgi:alkylation response protein AidB-like acyl-CoA dehydrogenase